MNNAVDKNDTNNNNSIYNNNSHNNIHNNNNDNVFNNINNNSNAPEYVKLGVDPSSHNNNTTEKTKTKKDRERTHPKKPRYQDATPTNLFSNTMAPFVPTPLTSSTIKAVTCAPITSSFLSSSLLISRIPKYYMLTNILKDLGMIADLMGISIDTAEFSDRFNNDLGIFSTEGGRISIIVRTTMNTTSTRLINLEHLLFQCFSSLKNPRGRVLRSIPPRD
jgi:hypothetical protein